MRICETVNFNAGENTFLTLCDRNDEGFCHWAEFYHLAHLAFYFLKKFNPPLTQVQLFEDVTVIGIRKQALSVNGVRAHMGYPSILTLQSSRPHEDDVICLPYTTVYDGQQFFYRPFATDVRYVTHLKGMLYQCLLYEAADALKVGDYNQLAVQLKNYFREKVCRQFAGKI
jgi:hypothetical protein